MKLRLEKYRIVAAIIILCAMIFSIIEGYIFNIEVKWQSITFLSGFLIGMGILIFFEYKEKNKKPIL